ncbi:universal stress protein [Paraburkholderia sp. RL18-085-BIA-A]|uniref:universal stress protein n=1 Tax=Paraburkholderia sp. RL18-085-BIA-A TaxID=3031633 RepID=UPI0038B89437
MSESGSILVYYDGSAEGKCALEHTAKLALSCGKKVHVLVVTDNVASVALSAGMLSGAACSDMVEGTSVILDEAVRHLTAQGTVPTGHASLGVVVDSVIRHAALVDADMIVIGHRKPRGLAKWLSSQPTLDQLVERSGGRVVVAVPVA